MLLFFSFFHDMLNQSSTFGLSKCVQTYSTHTGPTWRFPHSVPSCDAAMAKDSSDTTVWLCGWGWGGTIRETDCSLTLPATLQPTEWWTRQPAQRPACSGPYCHGNQNRLQWIFHTLPSYVDLEAHSLFFFVRRCTSKLNYIPPKKSYFT